MKYTNDKCWLAFDHEDDTLPFAFANEEGAKTDKQPLVEGPFVKLDAEKLAWAIHDHISATDWCVGDVRLAIEDFIKGLT